jgi:Tfp pilus assembly protein PilN
MINLLPTDQKQAISYARKNTHLRRWVFVLLFALVGVCFVIIAGLWYINAATKNLENQVAQSELLLQQQQLPETRQEVQNISDSLNLTLQVLSRQILFSRLIRQVGSAIPEGAVLTSLTISETQGGIDLEAKARDYTTATQVQVNLEDPNNQIFSKADIINVGCGTSGEDAEYPCSISLRALFATNNQFQFISPTAPPQGTQQ